MSLLLGAALVFGNLLGGFGSSSHQADQSKDNMVSSVGDSDKSHKGSSELTTGPSQKKDHSQALHQPANSQKQTNTNKNSVLGTGSQGNGFSQPSQLGVSSQQNSTGQAPAPHTKANQTPSHPLGLRSNGYDSGHKSQKQGKSQPLGSGDGNQPPQPKPRPQGDNPKVPENSLSGNNDNHHLSGNNQGRPSLPGLNGENQKEPEQGERGEAGPPLSGLSGNNQGRSPLPGLNGENQKEPEQGERGEAGPPSTPNLEGNNRKNPLKGLDGENKPKEDLDGKGLSGENDESPKLKDEHPYKHGRRDGYRVGYEDGYGGKKHKGDYPKRFGESSPKEYNDYSQGYIDNYGNGYLDGLADRDGKRGYGYSYQPD